MNRHRMFMALVLLLAPLTGCQGLGTGPNGEWTDADRKVLAEDLGDIFTGIGVIAGENTSPYAKLAGDLIAALTVTPFDTVTALNALQAVRDAEPQLRAWLSSEGWNLGQIEGSMFLLNVALRRIERTITS